MAKTLWCQETVEETSVVNGFFELKKTKCLAPVVPGTEECVKHQLSIKWPV